MITAYPTWSVRRAFTAQIIINHIQARDEEYIDNMEQALGRTEWVKLYGLLTGKEKEAEEAFEAEMEAFTSISDQEAFDKTVAFFHITTNGEANVRKSSDYLPKMIELAGGSYIFENLGEEDETASSTVTMQMEGRKRRRPYLFI